MIAGAILVVVEVGLRLGCGLGSPLLYVQDRYAGYTVAPSQDITRFGAHITVNQYAMRSDAFSAKRRPGSFRMMFLGDSVTFGPSWVAQSSIFPALVPQLLNGRGSERWESLNASAPGWASGNEFGYLASRGIFDSNVVILVLNTGDLIQPLARIDGTGSYPTRRPSSAILEALNRYAFPRLGMLARAADPGSTGDNADRIPVEQVFGNIAASRDLAMRSGSRFLLVFVPAMGGKWEADHWRSEKQSLVEWVGAQQVPFLDMTEALASHPNSEIYFDGIHLRPFAHRIVAEAIANRLSGLILRSASVF